MHISYILRYVSPCCKKLRFSRLALLLFVFFLPVKLILTAQIISKPFLHYYSPVEYKGGTQIWAVAEGKNGLMYFANSEGILEYDGTEWRTIRTENKNTIRSLAVASDDRIIVGGVGEMGYLEANTKGNLSFVSLKNYFSNASFPIAEIWSTQATNNGYYFLTDQALYRYHNEQTKIWERKGKYMFLCFNVDDEIFVHEVGIGLQNIRNDSLVLVENGDLFADMRIYNVLAIKNQLFVATRNNGIYLKDLKNEQSKFVPFSEYGENAKAINDFLIKNTVYSAIKISDSVVALATLKAGVLVFSINGVLLDFFNEQTMDISRQVYSMFYSKNGNLWLGLDNGIINIELSSPFRVWDNKSGIKGTVISMRSWNNRLYTATGTGLYEIDLSLNNEIKPNSVNQININTDQFWTINAFNPLFPSGQAVSNYLDKVYYPVKDSVLLIGAGAGLFVFGKTSLKQLFKLNVVFNIHVLRNNSSVIFLGLGNGFGKVIYKDGFFYFVGQLDSINEKITSIAEDEEGNIWLAANLKGIYKLPVTHSFINGKLLGDSEDTFFIYDSIKGIPSNENMFISLINHKIKVYSNDKFYVYNKKKDVFEIDKSIGESYVDSTWKDEIFVDFGKNMWINTRDSAFIGNDKCYYSDSLPMRRLKDYIISVVQTDDFNTFFIGTSNGVIRLAEHYKKDYMKPFSTLIRKVIINEDSLVFAGTNFKRIAKADQYEIISIPNDSLIDISLKIPHFRNEITFIYSAPFFDDEKSLVYSTFLEGYDIEWSEWSGETKKRFTNLIEGTYIFKVKSKNIYGIVSNLGTFKFEILPPWYRTGWAYSLYALLLVVFVLIIVKLYTKRLIREKQKLERIVKERTHEIFTQKEELMAQADNLREANTNIIKQNQELAKQKDDLEKKTWQLRRLNIELMKLSKVASETDNAIAIFDKDGNLEWVNDGFSRLYGYSLEQFKQERHGNIIKSSENPNIAEIIKTCIQEKKSIAYEHKTKTRFGKEIWTQTTLTHIIDRKGETMNLIAIDSDITKLKRAEEEINLQKEEIEKQRDELEVSNATKNKFFRIIAHDLRNPISTFVNATGSILLVFDTLGKEKTKQFIVELNKLSQTTYNLLENLLDWSSCQMGEIPFKPVVIDLKLVFDENIELITPRLQAKEIKLLNQIPESCFVFGDENMIKTVVRNLLSNAVKFTPNKGKIELFTIESNDTISAYVKDSGIGIKNDDLLRLFRIDQHHTTLGTSNEKGSGLGLMLCKEFIEKNNGEIFVESTFGSGSTFAFRLKKAT